jgi:hypothetical protein
MIDKVRIKIHEILRAYMRIKTNEYEFRWDEVADHDKCELAALLMQKHEYDLDVLRTNIDENIFHHMMGNMSALDLSENIKNAVIKYYDTRMKFLVDLEIPFVYQDVKEGYLHE